MSNKQVVEAVGVYITDGGHLAFIGDTKWDRETQETVFVGYTLASIKNDPGEKILVWRSCGHCLTSDDDEDRIIRKV